MTLTADQALDVIRGILDGNEWSADVCDAVAAIVRLSGRTIRDVDAVATLPHVFDGYPHHHGQDRDPDEPLTDAQALAYLMSGGTYEVSCSAYGQTMMECAKVALAYVKAQAYVNGPAVTTYRLDRAMKMVVEGDDDIARVLGEQA